MKLQTFHSLLISVSPFSFPTLEKGLYPFLSGLGVLACSIEHFAGSQIKSTSTKNTEIGFFICTIDLIS